MRPIITILFLLVIGFSTSLLAETHEHEKEHNAHKDDSVPEFSIEDSELVGLGVALKPIVSSEIRHGISVAGKIIPVDSKISHVAPRFAGVIKEVNVKVGQTVKAGLPLASIQNNQNLQTYTVVAAKDGIVIDRHATVGESVAETETLFIIADVSEVWAQLAVDRKDVSRIKIGQKAKVVVSASQASEIGEVFFIAPVTDEATQSTFVRIRLANSGGRFPPGAFVRSTIELSSINVQKAAETKAVMRDTKGNTLYIRKGDTFEPHPVELGQFDDDFTEILKGAEVGEQYATGNIEAIRAALPESTGHSHEEEGEHKDSHSEESEHEEEEENEEGEVHLTPEAIKNAEISVEEAGSVKLQVKLSLNGEVTPNADDLAHVTPRFPGIIRDTRKNVGDSVQKGEVLAVVESNQSVQPYEIVAPISGRVLEKHSTNGEFNSGTNPIFVIGNLNEVWVDFIVPEEQASRVRPGQRIEISHAQEDPAPLEGNISFLSPVLDEITQSRFARAVIPNADGHLLPGAFSSGELLVDESLVPLAIKDAGIQNIEGKSVIFIQGEEGKFKKREITTGRRDGQYVEVLRGLQKGEKYIAANSFVIKAELGKAEAEHGH